MTGKHIILAAALVFLALGLRLWGVGDFPAFQGDDREFVPKAKLYMEKGQFTNVLWYHPPLGSIVLYGSIRVFGENTYGWRLHTIVFGAISVLLVYLIGWEVFGNAEAALLAALLLTFDPLHLLFSRSTFEEVQAAALFLASLYAVLRYLRGTTAAAPVAGVLLGRSIRVFEQDGEGKADAVRKGFDHATGDILVILDADLAVRPEDLPKFYDAVASGKAELVIGNRLVYPLERESMRFLNLLGNKVFSALFSYLLDQRIKDTLCGTKALRAEQYRTIAANRGYFGVLDPFGDFDLIFGAARAGMKIVDIPVRYYARRYGTTQIRRFLHGFLLLRMVCIAIRKLKFVD